jgi:demethylmenaquinone methyltransferase/2-methoxy-6-polyprenyl-1,4-benzoquinol methylase
MPDNITPYKNSEQGKKEQVTRMFDTISGEYDGLNRVISFGNDIRWRRNVVKIVQQYRPDTILDIATGTGDLAIALTQTGASKIVGLDISAGMLSVGQKKVREKGMTDRVSMVVGDSEALPFRDNSFAVVTVAFGVRNFENLEKGLSEIYRVLRQEGVLVVLETSVPTKWLYKWGYKLYARLALPLIGKLFSKDRSAYTYLSESAAAFPHGKDFNNILGKIGFIGMEHKPQTFGVASIYVAIKQL